MSPPDVAYLDQVYPDDTSLGLDWAGPTDVEDAYDWDPARVLDGVGDDQVLGIEAPLWTETVATIEDAEFLAFPRLGALAEIGWSRAPPDGARSRLRRVRAAPRRLPRALRRTRGRLPPLGRPALVKADLAVAAHPLGGPATSRCPP